MNNIFEFRWRRKHHQIYGKSECDKCQFTSPRRSVFIWSSWASFSIKLLDERVVSWSRLLPCCEDRHCSVCMSLIACWKYNFFTLTLFLMNNKPFCWLAETNLDPDKWIHFSDDSENDLRLAGNDSSNFWGVWRREVPMELWVREYLYITYFCMTCLMPHSLLEGKKGM